MFNRFWRADPARARTSGGTGLGLSISLEDAHLHGGWLAGLGGGRGRAPSSGSRCRAVPAGRCDRARCRWRPWMPGRRSDDADGLDETDGEAGPGGRDNGGGPAHCRRLRADARERSGRRDRVQGRADEPPGVFIDPKPPEPGANPADIVTGFLDAMTATPLQTNAAKQFLTTDAQAAWTPEAETITYSEASPPRGGLRVSVTLGGARHLDGRGAYLGRLPAEDRSLTFPMASEDGEWRIAGRPTP